MMKLWDRMISLCVRYLTKAMTLSADKANRVVSDFARTRSKYAWFVGSSIYNDCTFTAVYLVIIEH